MGKKDVAVLRKGKAVDRAEVKNLSRQPFVLSYINSILAIIYLKINKF